jgi:LacI family transcriptional regulator, galactose operon repressor
MSPRDRPPRARSQPSVHDVAARAEVSSGTVSNVLTGRRSVAPALAARVRAAVADLGYVTNPAASQLRSMRPTIVGVVVPDLLNPYCATFVGVVEQVARAQGYRTIVAGCGEDATEEYEQVQALAAWRPAGVLVIPTDDRFRSREILAGADIPFVAVDRVAKGLRCDCVSIDNAAEAGRAASLLAVLGHRRLLIVASKLGLQNIRERIEGARKALAAHTCGVEVVEGGPVVQQIAAAVTIRLGRQPLPTAILALTNRATLGALLALSQKGLVVPRDVSFVGFDDNEWMQVMNPAITAVRQPVDTLARTAWSLLMARLHGDTGPAAHVQLPCSLEIRASTAAPHAHRGAGREGQRKRE